jgi:hypothetical protein
MSTNLVKRDNAGRWKPGTPSPNPGGQPPATTARLWRNLLREAVGTTHDGTPYTRAMELFDIAYRRAVDEDRKDAVLWAKLILERAEGPARTDSDDSIGLPELLRNATERWLRAREVEEAKAAAMPAATQVETEERQEREAT